MYHFKTCAQPYCKDVTHDKSIGSIDISSMLVINEYIFVQVCLLGLLSVTVFAKTTGPWTEQGRNFRGPTACSLLSDRMSDINILSVLLLIEFVHL